MVSEERIKTNLLLMDELDMWDEFTVKAINDEWTLRYYNHIMNLLNSQVDESIKWLDSEEARQLFYDEAEYQYGLFQSLEDEWDTILENKYDSIEALLQEVYNRGKAKGYAEMREHIRFTDTDKLALEFVTSYNFALIRRLDNDTREEIKNNITSAVLSGENPRSVAPKIRDTIGTRLTGSTFTPAQRAVMIARTEISRTQNTGILQSYVNEGYTEVKILTAEDSNVCYTCLTYAYEFNNEDNVTFASRSEEKVHNIIELLQGGLFPPFHPNCRCTYLSVWETKGELQENFFVVNLMPFNFKDFEYYDENLEFKVLNEDSIPEDLPKLLQKALLDFDKFVKNAIWEYGYVGNLTTGKRGEFVTDKEKDTINIRTTIPCGENDKLIATHNHLSDTPFNHEDFQTALSNKNTRYMVVHTPDYVFIVNFKEEAFNHKDEIINEVKRGYGLGLLEGKKYGTYVQGRHIWKNYKNNKKLNKYMEFRGIEK